MFNVKKKVKLGLSTSKTNPSSSIGTSISIEVDDDKEDGASAPINIEEDHDQGDGNRQITKNPKLHSWVWQHYIRYEVLEEVMVEGVMTKVTKTRAKCRHCNIGDFKVGGANIGTTTHTRHLLERCVGYKKTKEQGQTVITGDKSVKNKMKFRGFKQGDVMIVLIEMVVMDEMPFSTVDKPGFRRFCSVAISKFKISSRRTFVRELLNMYETRKSLLKKELAAHRVSLTTDTWTSVLNTNCKVITAHFIDSEWTMRKRVLSFSQVENH